MAGFEYKGYIIPVETLTATLEKLGKSPVDAVADEWSDTLKAAKDTIVKNVLERLGTYEKYKKTMIDVALPKLESIWSDKWPGKERARLRFLAKQAKRETFNKWLTNFQNAMANIFDNRVDTAKESWKQNAMVVLQVVGVKPAVLGPARKLHLLLLGDRKVEAYFDPSIDSFSGDIEYIVHPALPKQVAQAVIPICVEAIVYGKYLHDAGEYEERDNTLAEYSMKLTELLKRIVNDAVIDITNLTAEIRYDADKDSFYIHVVLPAKAGT